LVSSDINQEPVLSLSNQAQFLLVNRSSIQWLSNQIDQDQSDCSKVKGYNKHKSTPRLCNIKYITVENVFMISGEFTGTFPQQLGHTEL
jgi:hypothetical protein